MKTRNSTLKFIMRWIIRFKTRNLVNSCSFFCVIFIEKENLCLYSQGVPSYNLFKKYSSIPCSPFFFLSSSSLCGKEIFIHQRSCLHTHRPHCRASWLDTDSTLWVAIKICKEICRHNRRHKFPLARLLSILLFIN